MTEGRRDTCPRCGMPIEARVCMHCGLEGAHDADLTDCVAPVPRGQVLESLAASIGPLPRVNLPHTADGATEQRLVNPSSAEMPLAADRPVRVQLLGEIARGGMGVVLKGRDPDLGRDLAVKVLLEAHKEKPDLVRRFVEEAQIGGQLQHPGVVPVYELGTFGDCRPYFTMKLVKGQTLAELLDERESPVADLPRFLSIFAQIGQTMAYVHARDVIHRDLKPSNVMVGSFGEVQVMDWGLAKVLPKGGVVDDATAGKVEVRDTVIATARVGSDSDLSQSGSVMGTPAYMAPEQARGEIDRIDERADVFALGSILCEVLTGQPAFVGRSSGEIHRKAALGDLAEAFARLEGSGAAGELIALAKECLAREREDRPRHAGAVTDRTTAYLAGVQEKLRAAEIARAAESARAEEAQRTAHAAEARAAAERRARRLTAALTATVLLAAGLGAVGWRWVELERLGRARELAGRVNAALREATRLRGQAQGAAVDNLAPWIEAVAVARKASDLLEPGVDAGLRRQVEELLAEVTAHEQQAQAALLAAERDRRLLDRLVDIRSADSVNEALYAAAFREAGFDADGLGLEEVVGRIKARPAGVILAVAAGLDGWATQRRRERSSNKDAWMRLVAIARAADPDPLRDQLRQVWSEPDRKSKREQLLKLAQQADPLSWPTQSLSRLGSALAESGEHDAAVSLLRRASDRHPGDFWINFDLAENLEKLGPTRTEEVIRFYSMARALRPVTAHPLAHFLANRGRGEEAVAVFEDLTRLEPQVGRHWGCLGILFHERGARVKAAAALEHAVAIGQETIRLKPDDASDHYNLGTALVYHEKPDEAIAEFRTVIRLTPDNAGAHTSLGAILCDVKHDYEAAVAEFRTAIRLKPDDATAHNNLGIALGYLGHQDEAIAEYRTAIRLRPDDHEPHAALGGALFDQGHLEEGIAEYRAALRIRPDHPNALFQLHRVLLQQGKLEEGIAEFRAALRIRPDVAFNHYILGHALDRQGNLEEAIAEYRAAIRIRPDDGLHYLLGHALDRQGKLEEAIAEFHTALRLEPRSAYALDYLARALAKRADPGRAAEALERARKAIALDPKNADHHGTLALAELRAGHLAESIAAAQRAIELDGARGNADRRFFLAMAHARRGAAEQARGFFEQAVAWTREHAPNNAELRQFWREAAALLGRPGPDAADPVHRPDLPAHVFAP